MRTLIQNRDLKTLFSGVAIAAVAGLTMGMAMYPNLDEDKAGGPQLQMPGGGPRIEATTSDSGLAAYRDRLPDYVVGTDALKAVAYPQPSYPADAEPQYADTGEAADVMAYEAPARVQPARWRDEADEPAEYPSVAGNTAYEVDLPEPPDPPGPGDEAPLAG